MKNILIAVDDTKASQNVVSVFHSFVHQPVHVVLLYVERLQGPTLIIDMLGEPEMSTLKEMLAGTEHQEALDRKAGQIMTFYERELVLDSSSNLKKIRCAGIPSEEILRAVEEEAVDLIILGDSGKRGVDRFITGTVAQYVQKTAKVPVLVAKRNIISDELYNCRDAYFAVYITTAVVIAFLVMAVILETGLLQ